MGMERWLYKLPLRVRSLFRRDRVEQELADELQHHIDLKVEELVARGMSGKEARREAIREMDGLEQQKELCRDTRRVNLIEDLWQDLRYGVRTLRRMPVLVAVIVISLALGVGANAAIFGVMNAVLLKMLPVSEPERLVLMEVGSYDWPDKYAQNMEGSDWKDPATGRHETFSFSKSAYDHIKKNNHVFTDTFAFAANGFRVNLGLAGRAEAGNLQAVSGNYFEGLRVGPALGRVLVASDDGESAAPVAVASYPFFRGKLGGDASAIGKGISINGTVVTLVGVAPPEFFGVEPGNMPDLWVPLSLYIQQSKQVHGVDVAVPTTWWLGVIGRLRPGVTAEQAKAEGSLLFRQSLEEMAPVDVNDKNTPVFGVQSLSKGLSSLRDQFSTSLRLLMLMVGVVLMIACANVAGLLLTRATARQREIAIRVSLGAGRRRIVRQLLTESVMLSLLGGAAGLLVMRWTSASLVTLLSSGNSPIYLPISIDGRVLAFTAVVALISGLLFGFAPAINATRVDVLPVLKQSAKNSGGGKKWFSSGRMLVSGQVALGVLLMVCAGLLLGTMRKLQNENLGFVKENLLTFRVAPGANGYTGTRLVGYFDELQRRIEHIPGVRSATFSLNGPVGEGAWTTLVRVPGQGTEDARVRVYKHMIGPKYFETLGVPVLMGRYPGASDNVKSQQVIAINEAMAKQLFHGDNPLGQRVEFGNKTSHQEAEIVGVVGNAKYGKVRDEPPPTAYGSYTQMRMTPSDMTFQVRTGSNMASVVNDIRRVVLEMDAGVPAIGLRSEEQILQEHLFLERTFATLSTSFAALALLLACVGLYGTVAYTVAQRTNEIGIRMALGAERERILRMMLRDTALMVGIGLAAGLVIAAMTTRYLAAQLFGVSPLEPSVVMLAAGAVTVATMVAGYIPARRASRVDPMVALRYE
jgi:predicted permease